MKTLLIGSVFIFSLHASAFEIGGTLNIQCGTLTQPKEQIQEAYQVISLKLEECLANQVNCSNYIWPKNVLGQNGEPFTSKNEVVNLWEVKQSLQYALECAEMKEEHPDQESGITDFSN